MSAVRKEAPQARILNVSEDEYFADPCAVPSLSQSLARTLITQSPLHAWTKHPRLNPQPPTVETSKARDEGSIIHSMLMGKGAQLDVLAFKDYRTKPAQEARDASYAAGHVPVLEHRHAELVKAVDKLRANLAEYGLVLGQESELAIEWHEEGIHGPVLCRCRLDNLHRDFSVDPQRTLARHTIFDLKKIKSADPETCSRHVDDYGYDIQRAAYVSAVSKLLGVPADRVDFVFIFAEVEPPYAINPVWFDDSLIVMGERRWARATNLWEHCLVNNHWPSYSKTITTLEARPWAIAREEKIHGSL
jgi:hypothetical protein